MHAIIVSVLAMFAPSDHSSRHGLQVATAPAPAIAPARPDRGVMSHDVLVDRHTGKKTEINVLAFAD